MKRLTLLPFTCIILGWVFLFGCAEKPILPPAPKAPVVRTQPEEKTSPKPIYASVTNDSNCTVPVRLIFLPEPKVAVYLPTFVVLTPGIRAVYEIPLGTTHVGLQFRGQNIIYFKPQTKYRNATIYALPAPGRSISLQSGICPTVLRGLETPYSWSFE